MLLLVQVFPHHLSYLVDPSQCNNTDQCDDDDGGGGGKKQKKRKENEKVRSWRTKSVIILPMHFLNNTSYKLISTLIKRNQQNKLQK